MKERDPHSVTDEQLERIKEELDEDGVILREQDGLDLLFTIAALRAELAAAREEHSKLRVEIQGHLNRAHLIVKEALAQGVAQGKRQALEGVRACVQKLGDTVYLSYDKLVVVRDVKAHIAAELAKLDRAAGEEE